MALHTGVRLGPYEITGTLGAGGMGEVYRARDAKLQRDVAIKVLPAIFTSDPARLARFEREARVLASLNHPHIAAIYGFEQSGDIHALVLELVEGETLAERINAGTSGSGRTSGLPVSESLTIARQIADALDAAHEKGIVHRDLKPANVKITPAGVVKILDFGLAKIHTDMPAVDLTDAPTLSAGPTEHGVLVGTLPYMSPEQARGQTVDTRADIWAFGCVLYELLTGRRAFPGETTSDTIAAILERTPDWRALPATTPSPIRGLLTRCLDKDLRRRLHHVGDARIEIEDVLSGAALSGADTAVIGPRQGPVRLPWSVAVVASLVALIAVGALTWSVRTPRTQTALPRISRFAMASSGAEAVAIAGHRSLAITPDGTVVYIGNNPTQIFVRPIDSVDPTPIFTSAAPLNFVFVSPDGRWIGFEEANTLKKVALTGGRATPIVQHIGSGGGATWTPDNTIIFATLDPATGLQHVSADGGTVTVLTWPDSARGELDHLWPEVLPGGRAVLFSITATTGGLDAAQVAVVDLASGTSRVVMPGGSHAHYTASGHLVYVAGGELRAVPFDLDRLVTRGTPVTVLPRLLTTREGSGSFVVAANGTLAYVDVPDAEAAASRTLVWVDRLSGREDLLGTPMRPYFHPSVSPDETQVAVAIADQDQDIWIWDLARRSFSQLTFTPSPTSERAPVWTDGKHVVYFSPSAAGGSKLFLQPVSGTGAAEGLGGNGPPSGVTPDGRLLFSPGAQDLMVLSLDGTRRVERLLETASPARNSVVSRDGRWLAYESDRTGRFEVYVARFSNPKERQWPISSGGGTRPLWAWNSQELFYVAPDGALMAVPVGPRGDTWSAASPAKVVEARYVTEFATARSYDVSHDTRRFLMVKQAPDQSDMPQIIVVQNWTEELKQLVPTTR